MTGAFLRVKRGNKFENIEIEHLTKDERFDIFVTREPEEIIRWLDMLCDCIVVCETEFKALNDAFPGTLNA